MKKGIVTLGLLGLIMIFTMGAAVVKNPLDVTRKLSVKNDQSHNIILKNAAEYEMKWSLTDKSPYQMYSLYKGPNGLVYAQSFEEIFAINAATGKVAWRHPSDWQGELTPLLGADGTYYKVSYDDVERLSSTVYRTNITRFAGSGEVTTFHDIKLRVVSHFEDGSLFDLFQAGDHKGNYIVLTDEGLKSIKKDGSTNWRLTTIPFKNGVLDVNDIEQLYTDSKGNIIADFEKVEATLDLSGKILRVADYNQIQNEPASYSDIIDKDEHGGYYILDEDEGSITNKDFKTGKQKWKYSLSKYEKAAGIGLFTGSFTTDNKGNVYFGANNGNVYSLDHNGKPRFTLSVNSNQLSYPDIIAVNDNLTVISVNNNIICLQKKSK
ncbi:PQQ-binding-like beta-propeller repeat protein [Paenibacillus jilunlii]|uniref:Outer membrane protein assembly factor BamB, contains PQQ-like beta-propeller repeat n=2 Tax=Paenibacillus jilunlii TaxID=682956 RepID=A0A1G9J870_9BACL|nr:PQQ-binding-like beta-propeller repeat protein [Paenibacillus jilunlii]KWX74799.1 hypothetical protein AML91_14215 [Paenibacillus jilunlii]SDL33551.1 Outer membrane protein assembly factor BamB, contains PQQ-like beta-propeller repeat [Paenibacillus jilunlii]